MTIVVNGIQYGEPLLELRPLSSGETPLVTAFDILRNFHFPSPSEKSYVLALIEIEEHELSRLEFQIGISQANRRRLCRQSWTPSYSEALASITTTLDSLAPQKARYEARVKELRHLISSFHEVPLEIWEEIFALACTCPATRYATGDDDNNKKKACECEWKPLAYRFGQLSHRCRTIAKNVPRLWSRFTVNLVDFTARPLLDSCLENADGSPLSMRISSRYSHHGIKPCMDTFQLLFSKIPQCRKLSLRLVPDSLFESAFSSSQPPTWTLEHLTSFTFSTTVNSDVTTNGTRWFWDAIRSAPRLTHFSTYHMLPLKSGLADMLPYAQLTSLDITKLTETPQSRSLSQLLPRCTSLRTLRLGYLDPLNASPASMGVVVPSLRELEVGVMKFPDQVAPLFGRFTFPVLQSLKISLVATLINDRGWISKMEEWSPDFIPSFELSSAHIEQLSFDFENPQFQTADARPFLPLIRAAHNVRRLDFDLRVTSKRYDGSSPILILLGHFDAHHPENQNLAPKLEKVVIRDEITRGLGAESVSALLDMIESRTMNSLETFEMIYGPAPDPMQPQPRGLTFHYGPNFIDGATPENVARLQQIRNTGVRCVIEMAEPPPVLVRPWTGEEMHGGPPSLTFNWDELGGGDLDDSIDDDDDDDDDDDGELGGTDVDMQW
ncbi:hypothetical protein V5O48_002345 [Marasmius crinis-equi]|uniref:F-box domain-containing protein n=1 Tax=Marasmius crinis-equi TaxID=585013 RepID=A0ABR3FVZ0_9AGAR